MQQQITSKQAWQQWIGVQSNSLDSKILNALFNSTGLMCWEIEQEIKASHQSVSGNLRHLVERGLVFDSGRKGKTPSNRNAIIWQVQTPITGANMTTTIDTQTAPAPMKLLDPLHILYRPKSLDKVIGQKHVVAALQNQLASPTRSHFYLFVGKAGCGKTTCARILAKEFGCKMPIELDAGTSGGVDDVKKLVEEMDYRPAMGTGKSRVAIIDEVHDISKQAWKAFLKSTEEPAKHAYYIFCTTEIGKIPDAIKTRAQMSIFKSVEYEELLAYAKLVMACEEAVGRKIELDDVCVSQIVKSADGCVRKMLVYLDQCRVAKSIEEVRSLCAAQDESEESALFKIIKHILWGKASWEEYMTLAESIDDFSGLTLQLQAFLGSVGKKDSSDRMDIIQSEADKMPFFIPNDKVGMMQLQLFLRRLKHNKVITY